MSLHKDNSTIFGLIRHAQTEWNRDKKIQGRLDSPLTKAGCTQADKWGLELNKLQWDGILASDMPRVRATVEQINKKLQLPVQYEPLLREQDWGRWEGKKLKELQQQDGSLNTEIGKGWAFCPPGGESRRQVLQRVQQVLINTAKCSPLQSILVVSHQGVMKCLIYHLSNRQFLPSEKPLLKKGYFLHTVRCKNRLEIERIEKFKLSEPI